MLMIHSFALSPRRLVMMGPPSVYVRRSRLSFFIFSRLGQILPCSAANYFKPPSLYQLIN
jgi:hypothetical protein